MTDVFPALALAGEPALSDALETTSLEARDWALVLAASMAPLSCGQIWKAWRPGMPYHSERKDR